MQLECGKWLSWWELQSLHYPDRTSFTRKSPFPPHRVPMFKLFIGGLTVALVKSLKKAFTKLKIYNYDLHLLALTSKSLAPH